MLCSPSASSRPRTVAAESVHDTLRLAKAYLAERHAQDQLVAAVPGANPRVDGPASEHPWERQLRDLERVVAEVPTAHRRYLGGLDWITAEHRTAVLVASSFSVARD